MITLLGTAEDFFNADIRNIRNWVLKPMLPIGRGDKSSIVERVAQNSNASALINQLDAISEMTLDPGFTTVMDVYHHTKLAMELALDLLGEESKTYKNLVNVRNIFARRNFKHGDLWVPCAHLIPMSRLGETSDTSAKRFILNDYKDKWSEEFKEWQVSNPRKTVKNYIDFEQQGSRLYNKQAMTTFEPVSGGNATVNVQSKYDRKRGRSRSRSRSGSRHSGSSTSSNRGPKYRR